MWSKSAVLMVLLVTNHIRPAEWLVVAVPLLVLAAGVVALFVIGKPGRGNIVAQLLGRYSSALERHSGLPAWGAGAIALGYWSLLTALIGFFWDVSWHVDLGRDNQLFTPPHVMILLGLGGILASAVVSIVFANYEHAETGWRLGPVRVPYAAMALLLLGGGAVCGFPLDDLWHRTYGIDVTMWSPTHLLMIGGAVFSSFGYALLLSESRRGRKLVGFGRVLPGIQYAAPLSALTALQLEFDLGVPQFQQLYHPVMIAFAAGAGLTLARLALGRYGALRALASYLVIRSILALFIGPGLGLTWPHFPVYVAEAIGIELVALRWVETRPTLFALAAGAWIGTIGIAAEWGVMQVFGVQPWTAALWPAIWVATAMALAAAVLGASAGRILSNQRPALPVALILAR